MKNIMTLFCGILFGFGLAISGMTDTKKVIGFLDVFGNWVPDLLFVMGSAVLVTLVSFQFILRQKKPILHSHFELPKKTSIDRPLVAGATIFGMGWGLYGYCPGPAIASIIYMQMPTFIFLGSMTAGMIIAHYILKNKVLIKETLNN